MVDREIIRKDGQGFTVESIGGYEAVTSDTLTLKQRRRIVRAMGRLNFQGRTAPYEQMYDVALLGGQEARVQPDSGTIVGIDVGFGYKPHLPTDDEKMGLSPTYDVKIVAHHDTQGRPQAVGLHTTFGETEPAFLLYPNGAIAAMCRQPDIYSEDDWQQMPPDSKHSIGSGRFIREVTERNVAIRPLSEVKIPFDTQLDSNIMPPQPPLPKTLWQRFAESFFS